MKSMTNVFLSAGFFVLSIATSTAADTEKLISTNDLTTAWGRAVTPDNVWREYPRPQLVRGGWESLNGTWEYAIVSVEADEPAKYDGTRDDPRAVRR